MSEADEKAAAEGWKEYHAAIKKYKLDEDPQYPNPIDRMYDGYFAGFYAGRDYQRDKKTNRQRARDAASKVLRRPNSSKAAKTARGSALSQRK